MKILPVGIVTVMLTCAGLSCAQNVEIFGGFSSEHIAPCGTQIIYAVGVSCGLEQGELQSSNGYFNGWNAAATWGGQSSHTLHPFFGLTADFAGHYGVFGSQASRYSFLFGPTFALRISNLRPFAHALFGINKETSASGFNYNFLKPEIAVGGGLDLYLVRHFSARLAQIDYEWQRNPTYGLANPTGFRLSAGIVFNF